MKHDETQTISQGSTPQCSFMVLTDSYYADYYYYYLFKRGNSNLWIHIIIYRHACFIKQKVVFFPTLHPESNQLTSGIKPL